MRDARHYETHLYTYAGSLVASVSAENRARQREKAMHFGHTEGECLCVEIDPVFYIKTGRFAPLPVRAS